MSKLKQDEINEMMSWVKTKHEQSQSKKQDETPVQNDPNAFTFYHPEEGEFIGTPKELITKYDDLGYVNDIYKLTSGKKKQHKGWVINKDYTSYMSNTDKGWWFDKSQYNKDQSAKSVSKSTEEIEEIKKAQQTANKLKDRSNDWKDLENKSWERTKQQKLDNTKDVFVSKLNELDPLTKKYIVENYGQEGLEQFPTQQIWNSYVDKFFT
jgi:hypothetical protein